ncbi:WhiB family transcriptional regulator [Streptomyces gardneri]|uniref:WhiB family transcriptional regulator n=1 Tax=Streptomyces gardneri TaxID=66892 RepID=UPI0036933EE4
MSVDQEAPDMHKANRTIRIRGDQIWRSEVACAVATEAVANPDLFFPRAGAEEPLVGLAKGMCSSCAVRVTCLEAALECGGIDGIRGGLTAVERKAVARLFELRCDPERIGAALSGRDRNWTTIAPCMSRGRLYIAVQQQPDHTGGARDGGTHAGRIA